MIGFYFFPTRKFFIRCFRSLVFTSLLIISFLNANSQNNLLPSIGLTSLPNDADSVCHIPWRLNPNFDTMGYKLAEPVADFTLYTLDGEPINLAESVASGKPTLLITCSYTCYVFRGKVPLIDTLQAKYGNLINIYLVYTVEVHPWPDTSVYFGYPNPSSFNVQDGILYAEPKTYGDRKAIATDMLNNMQIDVPVLIDGPCNNFWMNYECGPNTAYLLDTTGIIYAKQGWLDLPPADIEAVIKNILGITNIQNAGALGHFTFEMNADDSIQQADPESTLFFEGNLVNDDTSSAIVEMVRKQELIPSNWFTAMCAGICYPPDVDSADVNVESGSSVLFVLDIFTALAPDTGLVEISFRNQSYPDEVYYQWFVGITGQPLTVLNANSNELHLQLYPNPADNEFYLLSNETPTDQSVIQIFSVEGKLVQQLPLSNSIEKVSTNTLQTGIYIVKIYSPLHTEEKMLLVSH